MVLVNGLEGGDPGCGRAEDALSKSVSGTARPDSERNRLREGRNGHQWEYE